MLSSGDAGASQCAAGTANVLNNHLLAEGAPHLLCHDARDDVTRTAGRERDNHGNRSSWIALPMRNDWHNAETSEGC